MPTWKIHLLKYKELYWEEWIEENEVLNFLHKCPNYKNTPRH